jgi:hypothetical protein
MIVNHREESEEAEAFGFLFLIRRKWKTVKASIDFVDFLVAKSFVNLIEEWFQSLPKTPEPSQNTLLFKNMNLLRLSLGQMGRVGMATFLGTYVYLSGTQGLTISKSVLAASIGLFIWSVLVIVESSVTKRLFRRVSANVIPSVIVLTEKDSSSYDDIKEKVNNPLVTTFNVILSVLGAISINIVASYIYARLSS